MCNDASHFGLTPDFFPSASTEPSRMPSTKDDFDKIQPDVSARTTTCVENQK